MWIDVDLGGRCSVYWRDMNRYAAVARQTLQLEINCRAAILAAATNGGEDRRPTVGN